VWHVKEPSLLKAVSAKCSPATGNGDSRQIAEKLLVPLKTNKQTNINPAMIIVINTDKDVQNMGFSYASSLVV
jgi:hypothetical protein